MQTKWLLYSTQVRHFRCGINPFYESDYCQNGSICDFFFCLKILLKLGKSLKYIKTSEKQTKKWEIMDRCLFSLVSANHEMIFKSSSHWVCANIQIVVICKANKHELGCAMHTHTHTLWCLFSMRVEWMPQYQNIWFVATKTNMASTSNSNHLTKSGFYLTAQTLIYEKFSTLVFHLCVSLQNGNEKTTKATNAFGRNQKQQQQREEREWNMRKNVEKFVRILYNLSPFMGFEIAQKIIRKILARRRKYDSYEHIICIK